MDCDRSWNHVRNYSDSTCKKQDAQTSLQSDAAILHAAMHHIQKMWKVDIGSVLCHLQFGQFK